MDAANKRYTLLTSIGLLATSQLLAAINFSGIVDIPIPTDFDGVYLDIETGNIATSDSLPDWDINFIFGGEGIGTNSGFMPIKTGVTPTDPVRNLAFGTQIDFDSDFYGGEFTGSSTHMGKGIEQFASGTPGYLGFKFISDQTSETKVGSMHVTLYNDGNIGTIHSWSWEDEGDEFFVGAVPEASHFGLLAGAIALSVACSSSKRSRRG